MKTMLKSKRNLLILACLVTASQGLFIDCVCAVDPRTEAARRPRRVIFNNDGDDVVHYAMYQSAPASREGLLSIRMDHVDRCDVDTVFYCTTQSFNHFSHDSKITEVFTTKEGAFKNNRTAELIAQGADPLQVMIDACRAKGIEIIFTIRVNDIHDNFWNEMISQWKKDHPEMLMGKPADKAKYPSSDPRHVWTYADFAHQEVRDRMVTIVRDVLDRYNVDGIDLDFLRHPAFFKESLIFEPATEEHLEMLTDMVRKIRSEVLAASERKKKPVLLSVRVLPTLELNRRFGFDAEQWIKQGLVDFIAVGGGYDPLTMPAKDMIDRGHAAGVPVYVCLSCSGFSNAANVTSHTRIGNHAESWRAAAANAWLAGADGIQTFNLFPNKPGTEVTRDVRQIWKDIGSPTALAGQDKIYGIENLDTYNKTGYMVGTVPVDGRLPVDIRKGSAVERVLPVADNVATEKDRLKTLRLRLCLKGLDKAAEVSVKINGTPLNVAEEQAVWHVADVPAEAMRQGDNVIAIEYQDGQAESINWIAAELVVRYKKPKLSQQGTQAVKRVPVKLVAHREASEVSQRELDSKSGNGLFARMWRTAACPETSEPKCPSIALNEEGELLLMFTHKASNMDVLAVARSSDQGKTWTEPKTVYSFGSVLPKALGTLTRLSSGQFLAPFVQEPGTVRILSSADDGKTWEASRPIDCSPLENATPYSRLVELDDELLMPIYGRLSVAGKKAPCSGLLRSKDEGKTWGDFSVIACDRQDGKAAFGATAVHADPSGRLLALISVDGKFLYRSTSADGGRTWSAPDQRLMASNAALVTVGPTLACVNQANGTVRVQFSDNLFDSWRCDRMLDYDITGEHVSAVALDNDRLLLVHDRDMQKRRGHGTLVNGGIEVAMMQRNPAAPPFPKNIIPAEKRDRWELSKPFTTSIPTGFGEVTQTPEGRLLAYSGDGIFESGDEGKTFQKIRTAPKATHNAGLIGVLRSGRWLLAYADWSEVDQATDWTGQRRKAPSQDGYAYYEQTGVKGFNTIRAYYSDDQGRTWHGGEQPIVAPLVWSNPEGRFINLEDGTVLMTTYGCLSHEDTAGRIDCAGLYRSTDGGKTWGDFTRVAYDEDGNKIAYNEMDVQTMPDGTWVAVIRTEWRNHSGGEASSSSVCFSTDQGRTWTKPEFAFIGAVPMLALLPDGGLACATSFNKVRFSYDGGHTWSREIPSHTRHYPGVQ
ncbi:MAG: exo-alpha-sialidase, partial [Pirellulaceae bacterium]